MHRVGVLIAEVTHDNNTDLGVDFSILNTRANGNGSKLSTNLGVANVNLYYKGFEMQDYESLPMEKSPKGWWRAEVPKKHVDGKSIPLASDGVKHMPVIG